MLDNQLLPIVLLLTLTYASAVSWYTGLTRKLRHIPSIGWSVPVLSTWSSFKYLLDTRATLTKARTKWPDSLFKVPGLLEWIVIATHPSHIEDIRKAPEHILSAVLANNKVLQVEYTLGLHIAKNLYHIPIVRAQLTRSLPLLMSEVHDELLEAFKDEIPLTEEWTKVKAYDTLIKVVSRSSNRVFLGVPLCRNPEWMDLSINFTHHVVATGRVLRLVPAVVRPLLNRLLSRLTKSPQKALRLLKPLIAERRKERSENGENYPDKPVDFLSWLLDEAKGEELDDWHLTSRILAMNFGAIHTSSMAFIQALYYLAANPQYAEPLREEVAEVTSHDGWSKSSLDQMHKIDSFIKESQRLKPLAMCLMTRIALQDFTFSDGTTVPAGTMLSVLLDTQTSEEFYDDPDTFDGFRFLKLREQAVASGHPEKKFDMVSTGVDSLPFGHGRHACPGRYFAASELKLMLAHIVLYYDVRTVEEGVRPKVWEIMHSYIPDPTAEILFRRRRDRQ